MDSRVLEYMKDVFKKRNLIIEKDGFQLPQSLNILDVGCGGGILTEPLARAGATILGIDVNKVAIEAAKDHVKLDPCLKNIQYRWESVEEHSQHNMETYDIVILNSVLQHSNNPDVLLGSCVKTLKPGGFLFLTSASKTYESWFRVIIMAEMVLKYIPRGAFNWDDLINCSDVVDILKENHCRIEDIKGFYYDIFTASINWTNNINGFYLIHAIKN